MDRAQEKQFINEHASSWLLVKSTWLVFAVIVAGVIVYASSPLAPSNGRNSQSLQGDWYETAPRLQHQDDDPDDFFDPSDS